MKEWIILSRTKKAWDARPRHLETSVLLVWLRILNLSKPRFAVVELFFRAP